MPNYIALLRGINVAGHNLVAMSDLCHLIAELGFAGARSLLQSGNVVFRGKRLAEAALERRLEQETQQRLNVSADYLVRTAKQWDQVVAGNPFPQQARDSPNQLVVMFLKSVPPPQNIVALRVAISGPESLREEGRHLYIIYPAGIGRSKLTGNLIEKKLGVRGTARNWNTVLKLAALCESLS